VFPPNKTIEFSISFTGYEPIPHYEYACLIVDDLPLAAIKSLPPILKSNLDS